MASSSFVSLQAVGVDNGLGRACWEGMKDFGYENFRKALIV